MSDTSGLSRRQFVVGTGAALAATALAGCGTSGGSGGGKQLRIAMYGDAGQEAFMETVAKPFAAKYGVTVSQASYGDQNEMLANVKSNPGVYDIVRCSDFGIHDGIKAGLLEEIDISNVPNYDNLDAPYQHPKSDPGTTVHTVSFAPAAYVMVKVKGYGPSNPSDYAPLYDRSYMGKLSLRDYAAYRILQTALAEGYEVNELSPEQEKKVFARLKEQRSLVKTYWSSEAQVRTLLANKDVVLADYWLQNTALNAADLNLEAWVPNEGIPAWLEGLSIPTGSKNKKTAEALLNYMLSPSVYMKFATAGKMIPTIKPTLWDKTKFAADVPELDLFVDPVSQRSVFLDLQVWDKKKTEWSEKYESVKLGE